MQKENPKKRILFVNSSVSGGGAGKALISLLKAIDAKQIETPTLIPSDGVIGEALKEEGVDVLYEPWLPERYSKTAFPLPRWAKIPLVEQVFNILLMPYLACKVATVARRKRVDYICANHQILTPICILAGLLTATPVIVYSRECIETYWGGFAYKTMAKIPIVKKVFAVSNVAGQLYQSTGKVTLLHDCMDFTQFEKKIKKGRLRKEHDIHNDVYLIGYLGRIVQRKGIDLLIKSFAQAQPQMPKSQLVIIGGNDPGLHIDLIAQYKTLVNHLHITSSVVFAGFKNEVHTYLPDLDLFVMPSLNPEPFGLVYLEAAMSDVPCLIPDNSGAAEMVTDGDNGYVFEARNIQSLAKKMIYAFQARAQKAEIVARTKAHVKTYFSVKTRSQQITSEFLKVA